MKYNDILSKMHIWSRRDGGPYRVNLFHEYSIDADLETDSDQFHIYVNNPRGVYSCIFNKYDTVSLYVMNEEIMHGRVDEISYIGDDSGNMMEIVGRDDLSLLIDNDAIPCTINNVDPYEYLKKKCVEYKLTLDPKDQSPRVKLFGDKIPSVEKVVIGTNESEMTVLNNMLADGNKRIWQDGAWIFLGDWYTYRTPEFTFVRGDANIDGIPINTIKVRDSGIGVKSEVLIYGTMDDGKQKVLGTAKNPDGGSFYDGIPRRMVMSSYSNDKNTKYSGSAERKARDAFKDGLQITITCNPQRMTKPVWINKTARVVDTIIGLDATFFIRAVNYTKSIITGSTCTVTMVPDDATAEILWQNIGPTRKDKGYAVSKKKK